MRNPGLVPLVVGAVLLFNLAGFAIAVAAELPTEFDCTCDPDNVLSDSVTRGSLIAAPLSVLGILAVATLLVWFGGRWLGALGAAVGLILGVLAIVGVLGEPIHPEASDPPVAFLVAWKAVAIGLSVALVAVEARALYERLARHRSAGGSSP